MEMVAIRLATLVEHAVSSSSSGSRGRTAFQWGGTVAAIILLLLTTMGRRSSLQHLFLVLYIFTSFPTVLFNILRGQFGCWIALFTVAANLFFPDIFPASRFLLFVVTPDWVAIGLRDSIVGGVFCLVIGILLVVMEIRRIRGLVIWDCDAYCCVYCLGILLLFFFTVLYLCLGPW